VTTDLDPLVPRPIDLPMNVPLDGDIDAGVADRAKIFAAPDNPSDWPAWREQLRRWRADARTRYAVSGGTGTSWASRCFIKAMVWLWDERLFDRERGEFTPDRLLADAQRFGGFDAVVLWHAYPIVGLDDRNQFDFYNNVPKLGDLVSEFQRCGVRVLVDYNPWDVGTRREPRRDPEVLAALASALGVDGVFLDTMREGGHDLVSALQSLDPPPVFEGESRVPLDRIAEHEMSWAQWFADSPAPGVMAAHWFDRRHMQHHTRRWNRDHSDELQSAWMNGTGMVVWDAVFGTWVGWNERDLSTLRHMVRAQRALAKVLLDGEWTPLVDSTPEALAAGVYVSRWHAESVALWTIVNRGTVDFTGPVIEAEREGTVVNVTEGTALDGLGTEITVPARGVSGVLHVAGDVAPGVEELLAANRADRHSADAAFPARAPVRLVAARSASGPPGVDVIALRSGVHKMSVRYRVRETGMYGGAPFVEEWKPLPPRLHAEACEEHTVEIGSVAVATVEVLGDDDAPLNGMSLAEARAYAASVGARLPTEFEWQAAAADPAFRRADPLVWNWTESEHSDGVTRFAILKGGCAYEALGSEWYFDGGPYPPEFSAKLLLAGLGIDRSPSIGFRLAWDVLATNRWVST
jgi:Sulfatase-modifying factor enzyme 1